LGGFKGGDGGNGGYNRQVISVTPGQSYSITIGIGGAPGNPGVDGSTSYLVTNHPAGNGSNGINGGFTSFNGTLSADGGFGGVGGVISYNSGTYITLYSSCSTPNGVGVDGQDALVQNYIYPVQTSGTRSYLPVGFVTSFPGNSSPGGISYPVTSISANPISQAATSGENGFCIITY
jgi:hypothetical protein